jgi:hypothetical protein
MIDPKSILLKLNKNLNILREREAKYGSNAPVDLLNQISDHQQAIDLTQQLIAGEITEDKWQVATKPLLAFSEGEVVNIEVEINLTVLGDYVIKVIASEKESIFSGLYRFILAQKLIVCMGFSFLRADPFPYAKSAELVALCIKPSANNKEVNDRLMKWFHELGALINNPKKTYSDFDKIASELWLAIGLIEASYAKNKRSTEHLVTLTADLQRIRSKAIESLSNYSQELAKAHSNLVDLQGILHNSSPAIQAHLEIVARWIGSLASNMDTLKNLTPTNLVEEIADYVKRNPGGVSLSILVMLSNVEKLLRWTIDWTSKNSKSNFESTLGESLSRFPDLIPPTPVFDGSKSSINQLAFVLQHAREQFQILVSKQEEIKRLYQELNNLKVRLNVSNEQIDQKDKALKGKIDEENQKVNEIEQLKEKLSNLEANQSELIKEQSELKRKLADINHDLRGLNTFLDETQNRRSSVERVNQMREMVTSLLNKSEIKSQRTEAAQLHQTGEVKDILFWQETPPVEKKETRIITTPKLVSWEILNPLHNSKKTKSDSSFPEHTKNPTEPIDLNQSYEDLISQAKIDPQFGQQVLRRIDDLKVSRQSSTDTYLKRLEEIETHFRSLYL